MLPPPAWVLGLFRGGGLQKPPLAQVASELLRPRRLQPQPEPRSSGSIKQTIRLVCFCSPYASARHFNAYVHPEACGRTRSDRCTSTCLCLAELNGPSERAARLDQLCRQSCC